MTWLIDVRCSMIPILRTFEQMISSYVVMLVRTWVLKGGSIQFCAYLCLCSLFHVQLCFTTTMPRQSAARQQPINSFSSSADSSTSYLSARPKSHSPRSNFNPFSPLSPHPPDKELEGSDDEDVPGAIFDLEDGARRVYTRLELVVVGEECRKRGFVKPKGMGSLESWYG